MLDLSFEVLQHEFIDQREENKSFRYVGRWLANDKFCYETLVGFLRAEGIQFSYCQLYQFCHRFGLKVYPCDIDEANKLFYSPWRDKLFVESRR